MWLLQCLVCVCGYVHCVLVRGWVCALCAGAWVGMCLVCWFVGGDVHCVLVGGWGCALCAGAWVGMCLALIISLHIYLGSKDEALVIKFVLFPAHLFHKPSITQNNFSS